MAQSTISNLMARDCNSRDSKLAMELEALTNSDWGIDAGYSTPKPENEQGRKNEGMQV